MGVLTAYQTEVADCHARANSCAAVLLCVLLFCYRIAPQDPKQKESLDKCLKTGLSETNGGITAQAGV